jgi:predicted TPR repeat methyltransferase
VDRAREILETAMKHVPDSMLLRFASADFDEKSGHLDAARRLYEAMVRDTPCPLVFIQFQRFARRAEVRSC